jgi:hypothetical protein
MNLRRLTLLLAFILSTAAAHAQVGIYGKFDATRLSSSASTTSASTWFYGPGVGIYYDALHLGPISLGADLRGDILSGSSEDYRSGLFGLRLAIKAPVLPIKPYIQGSVGVGATKPTALSSLPLHYTTKFEYQIASGVDFTIFPHIDWRIVELGYGRITGISSGGEAPAANLFNASTGLVVRFP